MWRISNSAFSQPAHPEPDWALLRIQLSTASVARDTGGVPPIALLADEMAGMARFHRETSHLPFGGYPGTDSYRSLSADLEVSLGQMGRNLRHIVSGALGDDYDAAWKPPSQGDKPPWVKLFGAGDALLTRLRDPEALIAALDDALEATRSDHLDDALVALAPQLDELRAICELQRGPWRRTQSLIESYLTVRGTETPRGGKFPLGTPPSEILTALKEALRRPVFERDWAVWLSTLAGPSAENEVPSAAVVSGPIAVSGRPCTGDIRDWLERVRDEVAVAFSFEGKATPPDVLALGEPSRLRGSTLRDGEELWSHVASPTSFVARVAVRATSSEEAVVRAREALSAVYGFGEAGLSGDIRPDAVVWTDDGGWSKPQVTARDLALGTVHATRHAIRAATVWAEDLESPLDADELDLLRSRALVHTNLAPPEVRLMRAFASLERLTEAGTKLDHVVQRLWPRTLQHATHQLLTHLLGRVRDRSSLAPLRDGATYAERDARLAALHEKSLKWNIELLDALDEVLDLIHPDALAPALSRATRRFLTEPMVVSEAKTRHAAAWKRARRHRNLAVHGHRVSDRALGPTVEFLSDQLECAISAKAEIGSATSWLGALASEPDVERIGATAAGLLVV